MKIMIYIIFWAIKRGNDCPVQEVNIFVFTNYNFIKYWAIIALDLWLPAVQEVNIENLNIKIAYLLYFVLPKEAMIAIAKYIL